MKKSNLLNHHLVETGENYFEHFLFTFTTALWLALASLILLSHSLLPFLFTTTASKHIKKINEVMQKRNALLLDRRNKKMAETVQE